MIVQKIEVFENIDLEKIIHKFSFIEQLIAMNCNKNWNPNQIKINGNILKNWSELNNYKF
jgi:hypothetical protein